MADRHTGTVVMYNRTDKFGLIRVDRDVRGSRGRVVWALEDVDLSPGERVEFTIVDGRRDIPTAVNLRQLDCA